ncbi:AAA family ATPase [Bacillus sp. CGMCC 1.16607]|uniref:AAA family ATPase n=1 Tax=Bacillus sp. CGMCC 1.16607 TaxID=3351842 RepID=UPI003634A1A1
MRPLKLTLQAFGPYAGKETIDFTQLGNRTMFVISGKTGSGKTTIFDGISYGIYGKASGEDRNGTELRSQFADEDVVTEVTLEFSIHSKRYIISRSPQQDRKKKSGEGTTTITAKAELYEIEATGEKKLLAANVRDVEEKMKEIMLIDSNQFRQILMIPQGEFRKLLTSDSKDKEAILQRLFHTEIYKIIEEKLKDESTELKRKVEDQIRKRNEVIHQIHSEYNVQLKEYLDAGSDNDVLILPQLLIEIKMMSENLSELKKVDEEKQKERDVIQKQIFAAKQIIDQIERKDVLNNRKRQLEEQKVNMETKDREIKFAQKAAVLAQQEELCHRLKKELDSLANDFGTQTELVSKLSELYSIREQSLNLEISRENERNQAVEKMNQLLRMKEDVYSFATLNQETNQIATELDTKYKQYLVIEQNLQIGEKKITALVEKMSEIEKEQIILLENERKLDRLQHTLTLFEKLERQSLQYHNQLQQLNEKRNIFDQTSAHFLDGKSLVDQLEKAWTSGQAAILASKLHDGEACPVCGSNHHPQLANTHISTFPSEEELKTAKIQLTQLEKEKSKSENEYIVSREKATAIHQNVQEVHVEINKVHQHYEESQIHQLIEQFKFDINQLNTEQNVLKSRFEQLQKLKEEKVALESDQLARSNQHEMLETELNQIKLLFAEKNAILDRIRSTVPNDLQSIEAYEKSLSVAQNNHSLMIKNLEESQSMFQDTKMKLDTAKSRFNDLQTRLEEKKKELDDERGIFLQNMVAQGFETYPIYHGAKRSESQIQILEQHVRQFREEYRSVSDQLEQISLILKDVEIPNLYLLQEVLDEVTKQIEMIKGNYTTLLIQKRDNEEILKKVEELNSSMKVLEERFKIIGHLYEISKGQNTYRITFERFVLAAFLDDILREANGRLLKMTSGRYQLARKTDRSKGNVQSGLELLIFDQYTGQERHVKTLSGGESFKASLALALGLADVVQNYAGGVSMETMFIDEGFGTLDPESLDQAIEALMDIQSSGRLVGIISHVPELKERIDARLEVVATQIGSRTEFVFSS